MILLNFAHRITAWQIEQIGALAGMPLERVIDVAAHFDVANSFTEQAQELVNRADLNAEEWETAPLLVNLPSLSVIAGLVLAEIHGRSGHFPAILRLRPAQGGLVQQYEVAEILNLQDVRDMARQQRSG